MTPRGDSCLVTGSFPAFPGVPEGWHILLESAAQGTGGAPAGMEGGFAKGTQGWVILHGLIPVSLLLQSPELGNSWAGMGLSLLLPSKQDLGLSPVTAPGVSRQGKPPGGWGWHPGLPVPISWGCRDSGAQPGSSQQLQPLPDPPRSSPEAFGQEGLLGVAEQMFQHRRVSPPSSQTSCQTPNGKSSSGLLLFWSENFPGSRSSLGGGCCSLADPAGDLG